MYTLPAYTGDASVLCVLGWEEASGESFRSTTGVYSRPSQLFINKILYIRLLSVVCLVSSVLMVIVGAAFFICFLDSMFEVFGPRSFLVLDSHSCVWYSLAWATGRESITKSREIKGQAGEWR